MAVGQRNWHLWLIGGLIAHILLFANWDATFLPGPIRGYSCSDDDATQQYCTLGRALWHGLGSSWARAGDFVRGNRDEIIAVGTVFLAVFTYRLAVFTRRLSQVTHRLAEADRPFFTVEELKLHGVRDTEYPTQLRISYRVRNYGRSPGIVRYAVFIWSLGQLRPKPEYFGEESWIPRYVVVPGGVFKSPEPVIFGGLTLNEESAKLVLAGALKVFVFGYIRYASLTKEEYLFRFAYQMKFGASDKVDRPEAAGDDAYWEYT